MYLPEAVNASRGKTLCASIGSNPGVFGMNFHNPRFQQLGLNFTYIACFEKDVAHAIKCVRDKNIRGLGIAMPFKEQVIPLLDALDDSAVFTGAVNTVVNDGGKLTGYNTDVEGFEAMILAAKLKKDERICVHGSGGVARAVLYALRNYRDVEIYSRNEEKRNALSKRFHRKAHEHRTGNGVLINCTPVGMNGEMIDVDLTTITKVLDLIVKETPIVQAAKSAGIPAFNGDIMAAAQAAKQFKLYTSHKAPHEIKVPNT